MATPFFPHLEFYRKSVYLGKLSYPWSPQLKSSDDINFSKVKGYVRKGTWLPAVALVALCLWPLSVAPACSPSRVGSMRVFHAQRKHAHLCVFAPFQYHLVHSKL